MDEDVLRKIEYIHMSLGLAGGIASGRLGTEGGLIGLVIGYSGYFISRAVFGLGKDDLPMKMWLSKGAMPYIMFWIPVWIFVYNL